MSRLDSFILRMCAQRDILDHIRDDIRLSPQALILEIGLGNGRTFSHLRDNFPGRRIVAFDRAMGAHATSVPSDEDLVLGEIRETGLRFAGIGAALAHADIGTGYHDKDAVTLTWLPQMMAAMLASGGIAASGLPLAHPGLVALPLPASVETGRYFLYRKL